jgi:hypothetical protein
MASGTDGAVSPFDKIPPDLKAITQQLASELPGDWTEDTIGRAIATYLE